MIVHDFHVSRVAICPHKAEAILIVDPNPVVVFKEMMKLPGYVEILSMPGRAIRRLMRLRR